ncbi:hypothetical protein JTB14_035003 [Gonioctena quinquepunctata]|nr:hypothetical protein JTB14_035003 [Gonioctena quinquepunctata]
MTGASVNFIRADVLYQKNLSGLPTPTAVFLGCQNNTMCSLGHIKMEIEIEDRIYSQIFRVLENLNEDIILGMTFLRENQAILDLNRGCVYFGRMPRQT